MITNEERLKYYLGNIFTNKIIIKNNDNFIDKINNYKWVNIWNTVKINRNTLENGENNKSYKEIVDFLPYNKSFLYSIGDISWNINLPSITKNRNSTKCSSIIFKSMNSIRHWNKDIFFIAINDNYNKILKCLWRGVTTGRPNIEYNNEKYFRRKILVEKYYNKNIDLIDVGFNKICQEKIDCKIYLKNFISIEEQLKYKFLISVEGNDVATDLKWKLLSKSVVLMPKPTKFSWLMEDKLIPNYHYILLDDEFNNLEEKIIWAINNPEKVEEIIKNANIYMNQFLDEENELYLQNEIIKIYFENVEFEDEN